MPRIDILHIHPPHDARTLPQDITTSSNLNGPFTRTVATRSIIGHLFLQNGTVAPPADTSGHHNDHGGQSKSMMGALFFATFILITGGVLFMRRVQQLRRAHQPLSKLFTYRTISPSSGASPPHPGTTPTLPSPLVRIPCTSLIVTRRSQLQAHAITLDTWASERIGPRSLGLENEPDGALEDKEVLPIYDAGGRPPKYVDGGNRRMGLEHGTSCPGAMTDAPPGSPASISVDVDVRPPPIYLRAACAQSGHEQLQTPFYRG